MATSLSASIQTHQMYQKANMDRGHVLLGLMKPGIYESTKLACSAAASTRREHTPAGGSWDGYFTCNAVYTNDMHCMQVGVLFASHHGEQGSGSIKEVDIQERNQRL